MLTGMEVAFGNIALQLLAAKAVYWPARQTLFVADLHFGKGTAMRRSGLPVPSGSTAETLERLTRVVDQCQPSRLIILGDLFHARSSLSSAVCDQVGQYFQSLTSTSISLVIGNHDLATGRLPSQWPIDPLRPGSVIDGITLFHEPGVPASDSDLALCGHIHPSVQVGNQRETLGKHPCFWHNERCLVLPAFGSFTGTHPVSPRHSDQVWAIVGEAVIAVRPKHRQ